MTQSYTAATFCAYYKEAWKATTLYAYYKEAWKSRHHITAAALATVPSGTATGATTGTNTPTFVTNASTHNVDPHQKELDDWVQTKRSMKDLEVLTSDAHYSSWTHMFIAQAKVQGISEPLDKKHHVMQTTSPAKMYESSAVFKELITMSIKNYAGTRVKHFYRIL